MQGWAGSRPSCGNYSASLRQLQRDHAYFHTAVSVTNDQKNTQLFGTCGNVPQLHPLHQHLNAVDLRSLTKGLLYTAQQLPSFTSVPLLCRVNRPGPSPKQAPEYAMEYPQLHSTHALIAVPLPPRT